jgi:SNF2 family DNA or RNA helicase
MAAMPALVVADAPGLGKTATTVLAADLVDARHILVLCPAAVKGHWARTFQEWGKISRTINVAVGIPRKIEKPAVTICSHASIVQAEDAILFAAHGPWDAIIVDESHELRRFTAARTVHMFGMHDYSLWRHTKRVWCLTGTPIVASAHDLFPLYSSVLAIYMPEKAEEWDFREYFTDVVVDVRGNVKSRGVKRLPEFVNRFKPFVMRRTLESVGIQLPALIQRDLEVDLPYEAVTDILDQLTGWSADRIFDAAQGSNPEDDSTLSVVRRALGNAKIKFALDRIKSLHENGVRPIVVFFHHRDVRIALVKLLNEIGYRVSYIDGTVTAKQLGLAQTWFQNGWLDVLLVQTQAGGMGLTLTSGNYALVVEPPWTAMAAEQMAKRIHRIGQTRDCVVETLVAPQVFLDGVMQRVVAAKAATADLILTHFLRHS